MYSLLFPVSVAPSVVDVSDGAEGAAQRFGEFHVPRGTPKSPLVLSVRSSLGKGGNPISVVISAFLYKICRFRVGSRARVWFHDAF